jgi:quercetin dioxygenase-like cupin family protein
MAQKLVRKAANSPDETRLFQDGKGKMHVFALGEMTVGRGEFEPGWRWSQHVKPIAGTPLCQATHTGYIIEGRMLVKMEDGSETEFGPGDFFFMPAGHDAWIIGEKRCVILDFTGVAKYAKKS